ncbi:hypothetical protein PGTUg99_005064 [Puccinia graminis f. sp. tritici]|uniref:Uncharacterized protein n=1 Tax=Puccinia graminis f. sp. tritici TaxID=56615 RepID=A0A5B0MA26_PUCGR|nr:hypothetical protein PGTUg99_005064 [Puccinia graminis f. sp. tritici]
MDYPKFERGCLGLKKDDRSLAFFVEQISSLCYLCMWFASTTFGMAVDKTVEYNSERNVGGHLWALPEPPTDKSIQQDLGKEALWRASQQDPFLTHTEADDEDREYLFRYIEGLPQFASLKNQNYSQVMNNREKHRKLESLYGDSREVEAMFQDVEKLLTKIKSRTKTPNEIFDKYHDAFKKTEKFKEELSIYKQKETCNLEK